MGGSVIGAGMGVMDNVMGVADNAAAAVADVTRANPFGVGALVLDDVGVAASRADESAGRIRTLIEQFGEGPLDDAAEASTKDARIGAFRLNKDGQERLARYVDDPSLVEPEVSSLIHQADARLEDAGWQLARKPSPDGRFNGIDLPGALRDTVEAAATLRRIAPLPA